MPDHEKWQEYLEAARCKIKIADYHFNWLTAEAAQGQFYTATIPIQAHFEGLLYAFVAATDKAGAAIDSLMRLDVGSTALAEMCSLKDQLSGSRSTPIATDVRKLRNLATHSYYKKVPDGSGLKVQELTGRDQSSYRGSRDLVEYGKAAVDHLHALTRILEQL
jgi:hypothetical protein